MVEFFFTSMSMPDEDNAMFTAHQSEMIRDHIILYGEEVFGTLDPVSSYNRLHEKKLTSGTFQMYERLKLMLPIGNY